MKSTKRKIKKAKLQEAGITLLALVVTIIVLLILAGVTISLALNNNGVIERSQHASNTWANATKNEITMMGELDQQIGELTNGNSGGGSEDVKTNTIVDFLKITPEGAVSFNFDKYFSLDEHNNRICNTALLESDGWNEYTTIDIPTAIRGITVTSVAEEGFFWYSYYLDRITSISVPNTVTVIGADAFNGCDEQIVHLPNSIQRIGGDAFYDGGKFDYSGTVAELKNIFFQGMIPYFCERTIHCSDGDYQFPSYEQFKSKVGDSYSGTISNFENL